MWSPGEPPPRVDWRTGKPVNRGAHRADTQTDMPNPPWYLRVSGVIVCAVGIAQLLAGISSVLVPAGGRLRVADLVVGALLSILGAAQALGRRWGYPGILLVAVVAIVAGVALVLGDQGVPPGNFMVGFLMAAFGMALLATAVSPRSIRWVKGGWRPSA